MASGKKAPSGEAARETTSTLDASGLVPGDFVCGQVIYVPAQTTSRFVNLNDVQELDSSRNWATLWLTVTAAYWPLMAARPGFYNWLGYSVGGVFTLATIATWLKVFTKTRRLERGLVPMPAQAFFDAIRPYATKKHEPEEATGLWHRLWRHIPWVAEQKP